MTDDERSIPGRVRAFETVVRMAIEYEEPSGFGYGADIETSEVVREIDADVSERTVLRACKDAAALGWLDDKIEGWDVGPRADDFDPSLDLPGEAVE